MRRMLPYAIVASLLASASGAQALKDCTSYDISRVDTAHSPTLVLRNVGVRGWNLFDVSADRSHVLFAHGPLYTATTRGDRV